MPYSAQNTVTTCAIYTRISTRDQSTEQQGATLRDYATRRNWTVAAEFTDTASGSDSARPGIHAMMNAASRKEFDVLLFYRFDRLTRAGILDTLTTLRDLSNYGIEYESYSEPHIRSAGHFGDLIVAIIATIAQTERELNRERTRAGMQRARKQGKQIGRPRVIADRSKLEKLRDENYSHAQISKLTGISKSTVTRLLSAGAGAR